MLTRNRKMMMLTLISFLFTTSLFQNCSLSKFNSGTSSTNGGGLDLFSTYAPQSMSGVQNVSSGNVVLKEYRYKSMNRFFYTSRVNDQALLESTYTNQFEVTGNTITIRAEQDAGLSPVYRLFNKAGYHLYTADSSEQNIALSSSQFRDEGIEGYAIKINPAASCPSSTFSVNRLFHNAQSKYRLVTDTTLKAQLISQGFVDQGILFCATAVSNTAPVIQLSCDFNGANIAHGASVTAYQSASVSNGSNCISQQRSCSNGTLSGNFQNSSCTIAPPAGGTASCTLGSTTLLHGQSAVGYNSSTVPNGSTCSSQSVTCSNGVLSLPSYSFNTCTVLPASTPPTGSDLCAGQTVYTGVAMNPSLNFERRTTGYWYSDSRDIPPGMSDGDIVVIPFNVTSAMTTQGVWPSNLAFSDIGAQRAGKLVTISQRKCDFSETVKVWISPPVSYQPGGMNSNSQTFVLNDTSAAHSQYTNLTTGQWYINVKLPRGSCPANSKCDVVLDYHGIGSN